MRYIKKVSVSSLETSGRIIDSLNTPDNPHINAPSLNAVKSANAEINAQVAALEDDQYYKNGDVIEFAGDGYFAGPLMVPGVFYSNTAYLGYKLSKKLKPTQTVSIEVIENGAYLSFCSGGGIRIQTPGIPTVYALSAETYPDLNQIIIKVNLAQPRYNDDGPCMLCGGGIRLTINGD